MLFPSLVLLALAIPFLQSSDRSGTAITVQSNVRGNQAQRTTYIQPDRQRMEYRNSFGAERSRCTVLAWYGSYAATSDSRSN
jgi:hypothetical protein